MIIGVVKESFPSERRVALVPASVAGLVKSGNEVIVESGSGMAAGFPDAQYSEAGAQLVGNRAEVFTAADCIVQVRSLGSNSEAGRADLSHLRQGQVLIGMADPLANPQAVRQLAERGVSLLALELVPRITRAQSMDVLSSMASIAGYRAVLLAATTLPKMFPMMTTAAGTITPAKVFIMGTGVAGLQAIASARRLGAVVSANDVRAAAKEQVQSLGARFIDPPESGGAEGQGGYAKAMDEEFYRKQREIVTPIVAQSDVVITTAAVPGRKAPILVTAEMIKGMAPGSVIVDVAAERGGNCELTVPGETVVKHGVTIMGPANLPADVPFHASQMFARNITSLLGILIKDGKFDLDMQDQITRETLVLKDGEIVNPRVRELLGQGELAGAAK